MNKEEYLNMQRQQYEKEAASWSLENRNPVVGSYDAHNEWADYDTYLFKGFDTTDMVAVEYGCGPGRNLIRYSPRFKYIIGVDISSTNLEKAIYNTHKHGVENYGLQRCNGDDIPLDDASTDVVFSVICLQHICSHTIRFNIMKEAYRVLKPEGYFCFQMGFGGRSISDVRTADYYEDAFDAASTNSGHDTAVMNTEQLYGDLHKIGFREFKFDIRPTGPGDKHANWIWVQVRK